MKSVSYLLLLSLVTNALLLALWISKPRAGLAVISAPPAKAVQKAAPRPFFDWRQVNSPDFATYVANLRGIGCPESTLRDIISAEVERLYASGSDTPPMDKASLVAALLSPPPAQVQPHAKGSDAAVPIAATQPKATAPAVSPASPALAEIIPAAFVDGTDPRQLSTGSDLSTRVTDASLDPPTAAAIETVREDFHDQMSPEGKAAPAPDSKEYMKRWWQAKFRSDDFYSSMRGGDALNAAARKAYESVPPPAKQ